MAKLHFHTAEFIQGQFTMKKLNLLLMFQVNCPGCFLYALPLFNKLYKEYWDNMAFVALSTAFEDYTRNTSTAVED